MKSKRTSALLLACTLAVLGLVVFQLIWMNHSRRLSEQIFTQRVCLAVCSTVENFSGGMLCGKNGCSDACQPPAGTVAEFTVPADLVADSAFNADLRQSLDFHQIDLPYQLSFSAEKSSKNEASDSFQYEVPVPVAAEDSAGILQLNFPGKEAFVLGKMNFMVGATVLILLFTAAVLLFANYSLHKQKRLLETNVEFFNNMAHEFRTPLTNVGLAANMLFKKHNELKDNALLEVIRRENSKLLAQVERVLHLARLENGDYALQKERLHLKTLLHSVREEMAMQIEERQAKVSLESVPENLEVFADRLHLGNVFRNLLDNALKYGGDQPEIKISAGEQTKGIQIQVQDNGIGIPAGQCQLIFEKFQRAGQGDLHEQKGFGLGLAYVKRMVELHDGNVRAFSENKGSRFEVVLPAV